MHRQHRSRRRDLRYALMSITTTLEEVGTVSSKLQLSSTALDAHGLRLLLWQSHSVCFLQLEMCSIDQSLCTCNKGGFSVRERNADHSHLLPFVPVYSAWQKCCCRIWRLSCCTLSPSPSGFCTPSSRL